MKKLPILLAAATLFIAACLCGGAPTAAPPAATQNAQPVTGATVEYNEPTQPAATNTAANSDLGATRDKPYPANTKVDIGGGMQLSVVFVTRPADEIVAAGNMFNDTPTPDQEYMLVALHVDCTKSANDKCNFSSGEVKTAGANGVIRDQATVAGIPNEMEFFNEFFGGSAIEGSLVFVTTKGDDSTVLFYDPLIFGHPVYLALK